MNARQKSAEGIVAARRRRERQEWQVGGTTHARTAAARVIASARVAFHVEDRIRVRNKNHFRGSMAGLCVPLSTLCCRPHGQLRMTRGRCGSLLLERRGLTPPTPRRFCRRTFDAVLHTRFAATDLLQRQLAAFLVQLLEAIEAVPRVAHHLPGLGNATQHLGQLQQSNLVLNDFLIGAPADISSLAPAGAFYRKIQIKSWLGHLCKYFRGQMDTSAGQTL